MNADGKVLAQKHQKFRQINRFLELLDDVLPEVLAECGKAPLRVLDFGSGKSYLTFAVQYFLTEIKKIPCEIFGLDIKKDVIEYCSRLSSELGLSNLRFKTGYIEEFSAEKPPHIVITLHACDTATDYALDYAVENGARAILSVPCCQHEINAQLKQNSVSVAPQFQPLLKYGIIKERFSALVTDALRAEILESEGYSVQVLEFIDTEGSPKNLMIRAVRKKTPQKNRKTKFTLKEELHVEQTLVNLRQKNTAEKHKIT